MKKENCVLRVDCHLDIIKMPSALKNYGGGGGYIQEILSVKCLMAISFTSIEKIGW